MNVHTEFAIAALAMAPLLAVSWAVTRQQQVAGTSFERATHTASARVSPVGNKGLDVANVQVDNFAGTTPSGFATSPQERAAADALEPKSGPGDSVRGRATHRPAGSTHNVDDAIASQSR